MQVKLVLKKAQISPVGQRGLPDGQLRLESLKLGIMHIPAKKLPLMVG